MRKPKNVGRIIVVGTIMLALFVAIMFVVLFNDWISKKDTVANIELTEEQLISEEKKKNFYENSWDRNVVKEIVEKTVPIPSGFEYVSGKKETGLIIKDISTNANLMWIPYDESAEVENIEEYYQNVNYSLIDSDTLDSIKKYGGFYVFLDAQNQYEALKQVDDVSYQEAVNAASKIYENSKSVNSHLLSLTQIEQVINFANKNGIQVIKTGANNKASISIDKLTTSEETVIKASEEEILFGIVGATVECWTSTEEEGLTKKIEINSKRSNQICLYSKRV